MRIMRNLTFRYIRDPEKNINLGYLNADMNYYFSYSNLLFLSVVKIRI